ncbi:hypothetical protein ACJ41O_009850 [Fusarium nematophilum]
MENLSSPDSITSTPTAPRSASKVTYTTAGTPYNPSTCQPLQPPARRGRSLKWGIHTSGLSLLPKSVLATLPLKIGSNTASLPQYSPLQENYDRPSSPLNEPDHVCINMSAQVPHLGSSATPSPLNSLFSETERDTLSDADGSEESSDDCELGMDLLLNMTVKSLHNLASYSNPNQKAAQKALRGIRPALNGMGGTSRSDGPSTPMNRSTGPRDIFQTNTASPVILRPAQPEELLSGFLQDDAFWNPDENHLSNKGPKTFDPAVGGSTSRGPGKFSSATLSSGPGAPRPLTAGPPGQRQYRPSTFETTFKALQTNAPGQSISQDEDEDVLMITRQTLRQAGIDNVGTEPTSPLFTGPISRSPQPPPTSLAKSMTSSRDRLAGINAARDVDSSAYPFSDGNQRPGSMATSSWTWPPPPAPGCWASSWEHIQTRYAAETRQLAAREIATRNERLNRAWYAGADFLTATPEDVAFQYQQRSKAKPAFGVIGDGRPSKNRNQYRPMEINDANRMSVADHAAPLLNMAFASVQEFVEDEFQKKAAQASK